MLTYVSFSGPVWRWISGLELGFLPSLGRPSHPLRTPLSHVWKEGVSCPFMIHWGPWHLGSIRACGKTQDFIGGRSLSLYIYDSSLDYLCDFGQVAQLHSDSVYSFEKWGKLWRIINCGWEAFTNVLKVIESGFRLSLTDANDPILSPMALLPNETTGSFVSWKTVINGQD